LFLIGGGVEGERERHWKKWPASLRFYIEEQMIVFYSGSGKSSRFIDMRRTVCGNNT